MDLDEAIKHCEEKAEEHKKAASRFAYPDKAGTTKESADCLECAKEHEQLAEWLKELKSFKEGKNNQWIPITSRPGTDEEYEAFSQYGDCPREDFRVFDCPLPDDGQEVLVTTRWGDVCTDTWYRDVDCCYFENNSDDDDVIAWMPKPEPYKKEGAE